MPVSEAKKKLNEVCTRVVETGSPVLLTRHGRGYVAVVSAQEFVALSELRKELELAHALREAIEQVDRGEGVPIEQAERQLGLDEAE